MGGKTPNCQYLIKNTMERTKDKVKTKNNAEDSLDEDNSSQTKTASSNSTDFNRDAPFNDESDVFGRKEDCADPNGTHTCYRGECGPCYCQDKKGRKISYYVGKTPNCQYLIKNTM